MLDKLFTTHLKNKSLAIVGNAESILHGSPYGDDIDSKDIVVKFNNFGARHVSKYCGNRCDLWVHGSRKHSTVHKWMVNVPLHKYKLYMWYVRGVVPNVCLPYPYIEDETFFIDNAWLSSLRTNWNRTFKKTYPTTGLMFLSLLNTYVSNISTIDLYGFDFGKSATLSLRSNIPLSVHNKFPHNWEAERKEILRICEACCIKIHV